MDPESIAQPTRRGALWVLVLLLASWTASWTASCAVTDPIWEDRARGASRRGDWDLAAELWYELWQERGDPEFALEAARAMLARGDAPSALALAVRAAEVPGALEVELEALVATGRGREAEQRLLDAHPGEPSPEVLARLASLRLAAGDERGALVPLRQAIAGRRAGTLEEPQLEWTRTLARLESRLGSARSAYDAWRLEGVLVAQSPAADLRLAARAAADPGVLEAQAGARLDAVRWFERLGRLDPQSIDVHSNLGLLYAGGGDLSGAAECWTRAVELDPTDPVALDALARTLERRAAAGDAAQAEALRARIADLEGDQRESR